jgi:ligand-binding sensor domain-containing protein
LFLVSEFRIYIPTPSGLKLVFNEPRFYTSSDGGLTWNKLDLPNTIVTIRDIEYSKDANTARILTGLGVLYYDLNKMTYKYYSDYFPDKEINFAKVINSTLFVGSNSGNIGKSNDNGETFSFNAKFDVPINNIYGSKLDPSLYFASTKIGVLVSTNGGETWARKQDNLAFYRVSSVLDGGKEVFYAITNDGLFRSYDNFENVEKVYDGTVKELMIDGQTIYFATDNAIFSTNDFKTFSKLADVYSSVNVITIQNGRLFIGTNDGLLVLGNGNSQSILKGIRIFDILGGIPMYLATDSGVIVLNDDLTYNSINN